MDILFIALVAGLLPLLPIVIYHLKRRRNPERITGRVVMGLGAVNLVMAAVVLGAGLVWLFAPDRVMAAGLAQAEGVMDPMAYAAAAAAVGLGSIGAAIAVSTVGAAAVGAIAENPDIFGRALIFVGLSEGVAIYGLIIAFIILR